MATPRLPDPQQQLNEEEAGGKMSFFEHLAELRKRLVYSLLAVGVGMIAGLTVSDKVIDFIVRPMQAALRQAHLGDKLIYTNPAGYINLVIKMGLYLGIVIASPFVLYQIWLFIAPGLYRHERRAVWSFVLSSLFLFLAGIAFGYFVMLPYVLKFLIGFHGPFNPLITINEYFDLILIVLLGLGIIFELPVMVFFLSFFGIVTPRFLWKNIRYAILVITVIAAIFTPSPDATTMLVFMVPMILLYVLSIGVSYLVARRKRQTAIARAGIP